MGHIKSIDDFEIITKPKENIVVIPSAIKGNFAEFILEDKYKPFVKKEFKDHPLLSRIQINPINKYLTGLTMYSSIALEMVLNDLGYRSMKFGDIQDLIDNKAFSFNESCYDLGVRFAGAGSVKAKTSKNLEKQLISLGFDVEKIRYNDSYLKNDSADKIKTPIWIPKSELTLDLDGGYSKGIGIKLKENAKPEYMKSLDYSNHLRSISGFSKEAGPLFDPTRKPIQFCASENGTSRILLKGSSQLIASTGDFSIGYPNGKVIMFEK